MQEFHDDTLGLIKVRRHHNARHISFRLSPRREIIANAPPRVPLFAVKSAVKSSRARIKQLLTHQQHHITYEHRQAIGQSHKLIIEESDDISVPKLSRQGTTVRVLHPPELSAQSAEVQQTAQAGVIKALDREARAYLPRRLSILAMRHGYSYKRVRYTHSTSRWGSCSSSGTISLNIALMKLPIELIDYVLIHELCHTEQMNHSEKFWQLVEAADPNWRQHRKMVKNYSPLL